MQTGPCLFIIAGPNGSGKTTLYEWKLRNMPVVRLSMFVNADQLAQAHWPDNPEGAADQARTLADSLRENLLKDRQSFCTETVFSHQSKLDLIRQAQALGYTVFLFCVAVEDPQLSAARVHQRVQMKKGHSVPYDKIVSRYPRSIQNMQAACFIADYAYVLDNSTANTPHRLILALDNGRVAYKDESIPLWAHWILERAEGLDTKTSVVRPLVIRESEIKIPLQRRTRIAVRKKVAGVEKESVHRILMAEFKKR